MSELAFDRDARPFKFGRSTRRLRPRRWKNAGQRGTCAAVLGSDGEQVLIDADADYAEFRAAVASVPGFYRLDQCDLDGVPIDDAPPAYVSIEQRNAGPIGEGDPRDALIRDLVQSNSELARTVIEHFAEMMQASAVVLRAADGAGLPRREPPPAPAAPPPADDDDDDDDDDDHDDADDDREPSPSEKLWAYIEPMLPTIQMWIAAMVAKRSSPTPAAAPPTTPEPAAPSAPAASSADSVVDGVAAGPSAPVAPTTTVSASAAEPSAPPEPAPNPTHGATVAPAVRAPIDGPRNAPPSSEPTPEQWAHLFAIRARLAPREIAIVERTLARMTTDVRAHWLAELSALTVEQATAAVQAKIPKLAPTNGATDDRKRSARPPIAGPRAAPPNSEPTPEQWAHLFAIRARLAPRELAVVEQVLTRMGADLRAQWLDELSRLTVEDATAAMQDMIAQSKWPPDGLREEQRP